MKQKYAKLPQTIQKGLITYYLERKDVEIGKSNGDIIKICHSWYVNKSEKIDKIPVAKINDGCFVSMQSCGYTKQEADKDLLTILNTMDKIAYESEIEYMKDIYKNKNLKL